MFRKSALLAAAVSTLTFGLPASATVEFWFIRHAETEGNIDVANPGNPDAYYLNELTPAGRQQAAALGQSLASEDVVGLYSSDALRTIQTAYYIVAETGLPEPIIVPGIREWDPDFPNSANLEQQVRAEIGQVIPLWLAGDTDAKLPSSGPDGESLAGMRERTVPAFKSIINAHRCDKDGVVAMVSHGASIGWTVPALANNVQLLTAFTNSLHNTGIIKAVLDGDQLIVKNWDGLAFDIPAQLKTPRGCGKPGKGHHGHGNGHGHHDKDHRD